MNTLFINVKCRYCDKTYNVSVGEDDFLDWKNGAGYIQDLLPYLTASERELLISNTCDDCWGGLFGWDDDEEDEY